MSRPEPSVGVAEAAAGRATRRPGVIVTRACATLVPVGGGVGLPPGPLIVHANINEHCQQYSHSSYGRP